MLKILIAVLVTILLIAFGISRYDSDGSGGSTTVNKSTIDNAQNAVEQSQNVQDDLKSKASDQLNQ